MSAESAAPCRHGGVPPESLVARVARAISGMASDAEFLKRNGLTSDEFAQALPVAIQRIRGSAAASVSDRRNFLGVLFQALKEKGLIEAFETPRYGDDTVYKLKIPGIGFIAVIQKGCPDGAHSSTNWEAPDWAEETYLWWLCPSLAHQPGEHVAKGVNRLRARFFGSLPGELDAVIFHNDLCGTASRRCPKAEYSIGLAGQLIPPPCVYVLPRRESAVSEWNWAGDRALRFPSVLLRLFGIQDEAIARFVGHVGFQERADNLRTTIVSRYGSGRSTTYRS
jgi:hypothetical protein